MRQITQKFLGSRRRRLRRALTCLPLVLTNCAVHYHDPATGTEHLWGFGHLSMKTQTAAEDQVAVVKGLETVGLAAGLGQDDSYFQTGWSRRQRIELLRPDAAIRLEGPSADFMEFRVGGEPKRAMSKTGEQP